MTLRPLQLSLGSVTSPVYSTGWYQDPTTGQYYYYDSDSRRWYIQVAGQLYPLSIASETAPKTVAIAPGDKLKITLSYRYVGPPSAGVEEYFSVGYHDGIQYRPKVVGTNSRSLPQCSTPTEFSSEKTLTIPSNVGDNWTYIECKVWHGTPDVPETGLRYRDALSIVGITAEITDFTIEDYVKV